jgi:eukaryotic-like serine/threonine-protein kinase
MQINRYQIISEAGHGGMAIVYLAYDPLFGRKVAIKVLRSSRLQDEDFRRRFKQEARLIAQLEDRAIIPVYDFGYYEDMPYFVMRFIGGGSLRARLERGPVGLEETIAMIASLASALDKAHQHGIFHRDVKPENILHDEQGNAYLGDFGVAMFYDDRLTSTGEFLIGTPIYMSPEQARGEHIDGRCDVYAVGVILFEMLAGRPPFMADSATGIAMRHILDPVPMIERENPHLPHGIDAVLSRALAKVVKDRYGTVGELYKELIRLQQSVDATDRPAPSETGVAYVAAGGKDHPLSVNPVEVCGSCGYRIEGIDKACPVCGSSRRLVRKV